jgi:hypothetical protein
MTQHIALVNQPFIVTGTHLGLDHYTGLWFNNAGSS